MNGQDPMCGRKDAGVRIVVRTENFRANVLLLSKTTAYFDVRIASADAKAAKIDTGGHTEKVLDISSIHKQILKSGTINLRKRLLCSMGLANTCAVRSEIHPLKKELRIRMWRTDAI